MKENVASRRKRLSVATSYIITYDMSISCAILTSAPVLESKINTMDGREIVWGDEIRYLGVFIVRAMKFKCSVSG